MTPPRKDQPLGPMLFYTDESGRKQDADLHSEMLDNVSPEAEANQLDRTRKLAKQLGISQPAINRLFRNDEGYAAGGAVTGGKKITRDAFLYMEPKPPKDSFAQCGTCAMFTGTGCTILGKTRITKDMTCALYVHGNPSYDLKGKEMALVSPEEAGLYNGKVRCENCRYGGTHCKLYRMLNDRMPEAFNLETQINSKGCCNAFVKKG